MLLVNNLLSIFQEANIIVRTIIIIFSQITAGLESAPTSNESQNSVFNCSNKSVILNK